MSTESPGPPEARVEIPPPRNIVLTGFMGTGKSTVGRILARRLRMRFVDTDALIERRHGPIPRIFEELGEEEFRSIEREVASELAADSGYVIATGGRFMLDKHNAQKLRNGNRIFCLDADIDIVLKRVMRRRSSRPMLAGDNPRDRVRALMEERRWGYAQFELVPTDDRPPSRVVEEIIRRLGV